MAHTLTTEAADLEVVRTVDSLLLIQRDIDMAFTTQAADLTVTTEAHKEKSMATEVEVGTVARNELPDAATFIFENADGTKRDLTGATVEGYLRKPDGVETSQLAMTITDATGGEAEYSWSDGDTDTASIGDVGLKLTAVATLNGERHFSDIMVVQVVDTYVSDETFATL